MRQYVGSIKLRSARHGAGHMVMSGQGANEECERELEKEEEEEEEVEREVARCKRPQSATGGTRLCWTPRL